MQAVLFMLPCCPGALSAAVGEIATNKPAILFVTNWGKANGCNEAYLKRLMDAGMNVSSAGFEKVTSELLAKFDVVVIPALPPVNPDASGATFVTISPSANEKLRAALDGYLNAGGGLLVAGPLWGWEIGWDHLKASNAYLKKWNAEIVPELVLDKQNFYKQPYFLQQAYSFTRNIPPSAVSQGVSMVWYPVDVNNNGGAAPPSTSTLKLGAEWTAVLKGEDTAGS